MDPKSLPPLNSPPNTNNLHNAWYEGCNAALNWISEVESWQLESRLTRKARPTMKQNPYPKLEGV